MPDQVVSFPGSDVLPKSEQEVATEGAQSNTQGTISTKFSDLAAFHQSLQTRLALTLAAYALVATATRPVSEFLPTRSLSEGAIPLLVYAAMFAFLGGVFAILPAFRTRPDLQAMMLERLASRSLASPDETPESLQKLFVADSTFKLNGLEAAHRMLGYTFVFLLFYALLDFIFAFLEAQSPHLKANYEQWFERSATAREVVLKILGELKSWRWSLISYCEHNNLEFLGAWMRRPVAKLLFEATNLLGMVQIILIFRYTKKYFGPSPV